MLMIDTTITRFLTEADVTRLIDLNDAMEALSDMLTLEFAGAAKNFPKIQATYGDRSALHALGSLAETLDVAGFKTWINTPKGASSVMSVFEPNVGHLRAMIQAGGLGRLRTAAASGIATDWMAAPDADEMAVIGTGRQAMLQVAAVAAVRKLKRLRVYSPTEENRERFAAQARELFSFDVAAEPSLERAVDGVPIVTLITRSREPFLAGAMLDANAHLNAVGAILPNSAEFEPDVFERAGRIVVDNVERVMASSKEFRDRFGEDISNWGGVEALGSIILAGRKPRTAGVSVFKAVGTGLADLAVARLVVERAEQQDVGVKIGKSPPAHLRWRAL